MLLATPRARAHRVFLVVGACACVLAVALLHRSHATHPPRRPLTPSIVDDGRSTRGVGGTWYIPSSWIHRGAGRAVNHACSSIASIVEAAECALGLAWHQQSFLNNSHIPLTIHQTWSSTDPNAWPDHMRERVGEWSGLAAQDNDFPLPGPEMAWLLWDDDGVDMLMKRYESEWYQDFSRLPFPVEKADVFRIAVLKWFGGVYADVDTQPLKHPFDWVHDADLLPWTEAGSKRKHTLHQPWPYEPAGHAPGGYQNILPLHVPDRAIQTNLSVSAILGIEADNPPAPDPTYWRMGYTFAVQVTNWALAMAPQNRVAEDFLHALRSAIVSNRDDLARIDPLDITGPPALTAAARLAADREEPGFPWDELSGLNGDAPGGRGKMVAGNVLILPITGFSPGRGRLQNMGSQPLDHPNARLRHAAAGSWRKNSLRVEYGKFCRAVFGMCKEWKKW